MLDSQQLVLNMQQVINAAVALFDSIQIKTIPLPRNEPRNCCRQSRHFTTVLSRTVVPILIKQLYLKVISGGKLENAVP